MMTNFHLNTTVVAIFPNVCLWRRSLCSDLVLTLKNCIEPPSYARTAYVVAIWPSFLFDSFVKIWATCEIFLGKWFTAPPGKKFPVRLWVCILPQSAFYSQSLVCILHSICLLPLVRSLQSAVRSLRLTLTVFVRESGQTITEWNMMTYVNFRRTPSSSK